jgi:hypothetical protein
MVKSGLRVRFQRVVVRFADAQPLAASWATGTFLGNPAPQFFHPIARPLPLK